MQKGIAQDYKDGFIQITDGIDSNRAPTSLNRTQLAWAVNATTRGEFIQPRPGWRRVKVGDNVPFYNQGRFQGAAFYRADNGNNSLIHMIDGRLYMLRPLSSVKFDLVEITPSDGGNASNIKQAWFYQGENFMVIQDTLAAPIIFNGSSCRRAEEGEITSGAAGVYHGGRIWYASPDQRSYRATDLVRGPSGTASYNYRDSILKVTENTYLNGGGDFSIPDSNDQIVAMAVPAKLDVAYGEGNLQVLTRNEIVRVNAPLDRDTWQDVTSPIATLGQVNHGGVGPNNHAIVNGDLLYRSHDGIRSYILANREFNQSWANTPVSDEISPILNADNQYFLQYGSSAVWKNYVLFTVYPRFTDYGYIHTGIAVLSLETLNTMKQKSTPVWEGLWNGGHFLQLITAEFNRVRRLFAYVVNINGQLELWELDENLSGDDDGDGNVTAFPWAFETCSMFKDNPFDLKSLKWGQLTLDNMVGTVSGTVSYKPDADAQWFTWGTFSEYQDEQETDYEGEAPDSLGGGTRRRITLSSPPDECGNESNGRFFYEAQIRFDLVGYARVRRFRAAATPRSDSTTSESCSSESKRRTLTTEGAAETYLMGAAYPT